MSMLATRMLQKMELRAYNRLGQLTRDKNLSDIEIAILVLNEALGSEMSANLYASKIPVRLRVTKTGDAQLSRKIEKANVKLPSNVRVPHNINVRLPDHKMLATQGNMYPHIVFDVLAINTVHLIFEGRRKTVEMKKVPTEAHLLSLGK